MKLHNVKITGNGPAVNVHLDGEPLHCSKVRIEAEAGHIPLLIADLPLINSTEFDGEAKVFIPDVTRDALIRLGWTPPPNEEAGQ